MFPVQVTLTHLTPFVLRVIMRGLEHLALSIINGSLRIIAGICDKQPVTESKLDHKQNTLYRELCTVASALEAVLLAAL